MKFLRTITSRDTATTDSSTTRARRARSSSVRRAARDGQAWEDADRTAEYERIRGRRR
ncbi:hypothetical protein [Streptomyces sp. NBC_01207]|uniref:hypothetical protein n=1 Tax=Streptomyces sp. NBC_01207 TaxID=2903772 RepID=UPI002E0FCF80|nr:hypothetical protein OG457_27265 [Streptomyces sp. NBC_01207]